MKRTVIRRAMMASTLALAMATAPLARAQNNKIAAEALFEEGRRLVADGKFAEACPRFESSQQLDPSAGTILNLANCYEKSGRTATAWATFKEAASFANAAGRADYVAIAQKRAAALAPTLARVTVKITTPVDGLEIKRDGAVVGRGEWGVAIPVDPGPHTVEASAPRHKPWTSTVDVARGASPLVTVPALEDAPAEAGLAVGSGLTTEPGAAPASTTGAPGATEPVPAASASSEGSIQRPVAVVAAGLGLVGVALGTVFAIKAKGKYDDSLPFCPRDPNQCTAQGVTMRDDARSAGNVATVFYGIGAAGLVAGGILWFTAPGSHRARDAGADRAARIQVLPSLGGATLQGSF